MVTDSKYLDVRLYRALENVLRDHKMLIVDVPGDGNCFYSAVARQLSSAGLSCAIRNIRLTGQRLREYLLTFLKAQQIVWAPRCVSFDISESLQSQISKITQGEWADHFEIAATATMFNITINIINDAGNVNNISPWGPENIEGNNIGYLNMIEPETGEAGEITIGHIGQLHYVGLDSTLGNESTSQPIKINKISNTDGKFQQELESTQGSLESIHSIASTTSVKKKIPMTDAEKKQASRLKPNIEEKNTHVPCREKKSL